MKRKSTSVNAHITSSRDQHTYPKHLSHQQDEGIVIILALAHDFPLADAGRTHGLDVLPVWEPVVLLAFERVLRDADFFLKAALGDGLAFKASGG